MIQEAFSIQKQMNRQPLWLAWTLQATWNVEGISGISCLKFLQEKKKSSDPEQSLTANTSEAEFCHVAYKRMVLN